MVSEEVTSLADDRFAARLAVAPVRDLAGKPTSLRDLWREAPTVTGFVRHYGCLFCHEMVTDLVALLPDILGRGGQLAIVGNGSVAQARGFFESRGLPRGGVHVLTDPERVAFQAAGFERGLTRTFGHPGAWQAYRRARDAGHRVTGQQGDLTQLGGVVVTRPPATLTYLHRSRHAGDHAPSESIISALARPSGTFAREVTPASR